MRHRAKSDWKGLRVDQMIGIIGAGRIGRDVIKFLRTSPDHQLARVLTRSGAPDTADPETFFAAPASLIIETAGPEALRAFGPQALTKSDLWTVSAVALADDAFRHEMEKLSEENGTRLRLFSHWIAGIGHGNPASASRLNYRATRPGHVAKWSGPLREAVKLFPDDLNSAVAAAICGPGLDATRVEIVYRGSHGAHRIDAEFITDFGRFLTSVEFRPQGNGLHPTAAALIGALRNDLKKTKYG